MKNPVALRLSLAMSLSLVSPAKAAPGLPDTGQTNHYTQTFGEDSDFAGDGPLYTDNGDGTVTDQVTGLVWQKTDGGEMTWEQAAEYARNLDLAGYQDWRLPASMELFSILNHGMSHPAMDTGFFVRSEAKYWWTDSPRADDDSKVWVANAGGGIGAHLKTLAISGGKGAFHVRCVRGNSLFGAGPSLNDNGDGTVTDRRTGLVWQKTGPDPEMTWEEALKYCDSLTLAGLDDWRLPNLKELRSLSNDRNVHPSLDMIFFPGAKTAPYWSSTSQCNRPGCAGFVDFTTGLVSYADKLQKQPVLAVRGGVAVPASRIKPVPDPALSEGSGKGRGNPDRKGGEKK